LARRNGVSVARVDLTPEETRVLGCLIEKAMLTPDVYPLTLNSLVTACNQSTSREPVVDYSSEVAKAALDHLRMRHRYVRVELPRPGSRVEKYKHDLVAQLQLSVPELAILSVMMLRGPQTINELKTRTERMFAFASNDEIEATIDQLTDPTRDVEGSAIESSGQLSGSSVTRPEIDRPAEYRRPWNGPLAARLPRLPGQKEPRVAQLLSGAVDLDALAAAAERGTVSVAASGARAERIDALEAEVAGLRADLTALQAAFETFKSQF
jgi:uncharacterized protein